MTEAELIARCDKVWAAEGYHCASANVPTFRWCDPCLDNVADQMLKQYRQDNADAV